MENMTPLTNEQQEYIRLKTSHDRMLNHWIKLRKENKISQCRDLPTNPPHQCDSVVEQLFYAYTEQLEKEQLIIN